MASRHPDASREGGGGPGVSLPLSRLAKALVNSECMGYSHAPHNGAFQVDKENLTVKYTCKGKGFEIVKYFPLYKEAQKDAFLPSVCCVEKIPTSESPKSACESLKAEGAISRDEALLGIRMGVAFAAEVTEQWHAGADFLSVSFFQEALKKGKAYHQKKEGSRGPLPYEILGASEGAAGGSRMSGGRKGREGRERQKEKGKEEQEGGGEQETGGRGRSRGTGNGGRERGGPSVEGKGKGKNSKGEGERGTSSRTSGGRGVPILPSRRGGGAEGKEEEAEGPTASPSPSPSSRPVRSSGRISERESQKGAGSKNAALLRSPFPPVEETGEAEESPSPHRQHQANSSPSPGRINRHSEELLPPPDFSSTPVRGRDRPSASAGAGAGSASTRRTEKDRSRERDGASTCVPSQTPSPAVPSRGASVRSRGRDPHPPVGAGGGNRAERLEDGKEQKGKETEGGTVPGVPSLPLPLPLSMSSAAEPSPPASASVKRGRGRPSLGGDKDKGGRGNEEGDIGNAREMGGGGLASSSSVRGQPEEASLGEGSRKDGRATGGQGRGIEVDFEGGGAPADKGKEKEGERKRGRGRPKGSSSSSSSSASSFSSSLQQHLRTSPRFEAIREGGERDGEKETKEVAERDKQLKRGDGEGNGEGLEGQPGQLASSSSSASTGKEEGREEAAETAAALSGPPVSLPMSLPQSQPQSSQAKQEVSGSVSSEVKKAPPEQPQKPVSSSSSFSSSVSVELVKRDQKMMKGNDEEDDEFHSPVSAVSPHAGDSHHTRQQANITAPHAPLNSSLKEKDQSEQARPADTSTSMHPEAKPPNDSTAPPSRAQSEHELPQQQRLPPFATFKIPPTVAVSVSVPSPANSLLCPSVKPPHTLTSGTPENNKRETRTPAPALFPSSLTSAVKEDDGNKDEVKEVQGVQMQRMKEGVAPSPSSVSLPFPPFNPAATSSSGVPPGSSAAGLPATSPPDGGGGVGMSQGLPPPDTTPAHTHLPSGTAQKGAGHNLRSRKGQVEEQTPLSTAAQTPLSGPPTTAAAAGAQPSGSSGRVLRPRRRDGPEASAQARLGMRVKMGEAAVGASASTGASGRGGGGKASSKSAAAAPPQVPLSFQDRLKALITKAKENIKQDQIERDQEKEKEKERGEAGGEDGDKKEEMKMEEQQSAAAAAGEGDPSSSSSSSSASCPRPPASPLRHQPTEDEQADEGGPTGSSASSLLCPSNSSPALFPSLPFVTLPQYAPCATPPNYPVPFAQFAFPHDGLPPWNSDHMWGQMNLCLRQCVRGFNEKAREFRLDHWLLKALPEWKVPHTLLARLQRNQRERAEQGLIDGGELDQVTEQAMESLAAIVMLAEEIEREGDQAEKKKREQEAEEEERGLLVRKQEQDRERVKAQSMAATLKGNKKKGIASLSVSAPTGVDSKKKGMKLQSSGDKGKAKGDKKSKKGKSKPGENSDDEEKILGNIQENKKKKRAEREGGEEVSDESESEKTDKKKKKKKAKGDSTSHTLTSDPPEDDGKETETGPTKDPFLAYAEQRLREDDSICVTCAVGKVLGLFPSSQSVCLSVNQSAGTLEGLVVEDMPCIVSFSEVMALLFVGPSAFHPRKVNWGWSLLSRKTKAASLAAAVLKKKPTDVASLTTKQGQPVCWPLPVSWLPLFELEEAHMAAQQMMMRDRAVAAEAAAAAATERAEREKEGQAQQSSSSASGASSASAAATASSSSKVPPPPGGLRTFPSLPPGPRGPYKKKKNKKSETTSIGAAAEAAGQEKEGAPLPLSSSTLPPAGDPAASTPADGVAAPSSSSSSSSAVKKQRKTVKTNKDGEPVMTYYQKKKLKQAEEAEAKARLLEEGGENREKEEGKGKEGDEEMKSQCQRVVENESGGHGEKENLDLQALEGEQREREGGEEEEADDETAAMTHVHRLSGSAAPYPCLSPSPGALPGVDGSREKETEEVIASAVSDPAVVSVQLVPPSVASPFPFPFPSLGSPASFVPSAVTVEDDGKEGKENEEKDKGKDEQEVTGQSTNDCLSSAAASMPVPPPAAETEIERARQADSKSQSPALAAGSPITEGVLQSGPVEAPAGLGLFPTSSSFLGVEEVHTDGERGLKRAREGEHREAKVREEVEDKKDDGAQEEGEKGGQEANGPVSSSSSSSSPRKKKEKIQVAVQEKEDNQAENIEMEQENPKSVPPSYPQMFDRDGGAGRERWNSACMEGTSIVPPHRQPQPGSAAAALLPLPPSGPLSQAASGPASCLPILSGPLSSSSSSSSFYSSPSAPAGGRGQETHACVRLGGASSASLFAERADAKEMPQPAHAHTERSLPFPPFLEKRQEEDGSTQQGKERQRLDSTREATHAHSRQYNAHTPAAGPHSQPPSHSQAKSWYDPSMAPSWSSSTKNALGTGRGQGQQGERVERGETVASSLYASSSLSPSRAVTSSSSVGFPFSLSGHQAPAQPQSQSQPARLPSSGEGGGWGSMGIGMHGGAPDGRMSALPGGAWVDPSVGTLSGGVGAGGAPPFSSPSLYGGDPSAASLSPSRSLYEPMGGMPTGSTVPLPLPAFSSSASHMIPVPPPQAQQGAAVMHQQQQPQLQQTQSPSHSADYFAHQSAHLMAAFSSASSSSSPSFSFQDAGREDERLQQQQQRQDTAGRGSASSSSAASLGQAGLQSWGSWPPQGSQGHGGAGSGYNPNLWNR
uniref:Uncharacterized protein n=1 Tax=Chromera velia CCMP2878 TaxID=1169474 RepID=A0A0G4GE91_9ALVE|eukprot:Cvel_21502.t1-p1 / transcript=Cvel_21502.t1 / gene=Cvel_21502 / organism=Chromera_velia_CCMP2878 / gene_product=hypothetical protein / transcript_product=hypothetical protein / location=Cvel_scaffold2023:5004-14879(+) / protein_length=2681 / sequence_SO=supercontig / SO=protein_coding / is_pseudo=false